MKMTMMMKRLRDLTPPLKMESFGSNQEIIFEKKLI